MVSDKIAEPTGSTTQKKRTVVESRNVAFLETSLPYPMPPIGIYSPVSNEDCDHDVIKFHILPGFLYPGLPGGGSGSRSSKYHGLATLTRKRGQITPTADGSIAAAWGTISTCGTSAVPREGNVTRSWSIVRGRTGCIKRGTGAAQSNTHWYKSNTNTDDTFYNFLAPANCST